MLGACDKLKQAQELNRSQKTPYWRNSLWCLLTSITLKQFNVSDLGYSHIKLVVGLPLQPAK